jgi:4-hydroxybenzoate polyprenyltransferase
MNFAQSAIETQHPRVPNQPCPLCPDLSSSMLNLKQSISDWAPLIKIVNLSFSGFAGLFAVDFYLDLDFDIWIGLALMGAIFSVYTFNCFTDRAEDLASKTKHNSKAIDLRLYRIGIITFAMGILIIIFHCFSAIKLSLFALAALISIAYSYRILPGFVKNRQRDSLKKNHYRFKEITAVKNIAIALCWSGSLVVSPLLFNDEKVDVDYSFLLVFISLFLLIFVNSLFGDIRDRDGDRLAGVRTIPVVFGKSTCYRSIVFISTLWSAWIFGSYQNNAIDSNDFWFLAAVVAYPLSYCVPYRLGVKSEFVLDLICEFDVWFFSIGLLLLSI